MCDIPLSMPADHPRRTRAKALFGQRVVVTLAVGVAVVFHPQTWTRSA